MLEALGLVVLLATVGGVVVALLFVWALVKLALWVLLLPLRLAFLLLAVPFFLLKGLLAGLVGVLLAGLLLVGGVVAASVVVAILVALCLPLLFLGAGVWLVAKAVA